jgi:hypothetical protein
MAASAFARAAPAQCVIVGQFLGASGCCVNGSSPQCNQTLPEGSIGALFSSLGLTAATIPLSSQALVQALSAGGLVLLMFDLGYAFHYSLLTGYDAAEASFHAADPHYGEFSANAEQIASGYGQGSLVRAWHITLQ